MPVGSTLERSPRSQTFASRDCVAVLAIGALGVILALQGWRSRVPGTDVIPYIESARSLLTDGRLPERGVVTSMGSYAPPGLAWVVLPGLSLFSDPRLFDAPGMAILHLGTLLGVFFLARLCFGVRCALLAALIYGLSERGLMFAASLGEGTLGPRGHPFFYVWMAYWTCRWATQLDARYLAAAVMTWFAGMFVFMEVAPAVFMLPAVWALYRPPVRSSSLVATAALAMLMWYPYLRFEATRGFADVRSQILLQSLAPARWPDILCDSSLTMSRWGEPPGNESPPSGDVAPETRAGRLVLTSGRRALAFSSGLLINFEGRVPGMQVALLTLAVAGLFVLSGPWAFRRGHVMENGGVHLVAARWMRSLAIALLALSGMANEVLVGWAVGPRYELRGDTLSTVRAFQILVALAAVALLSRRSIARAGSALADRLDTGSREMRVFTVALLVPWAILLLIAEWGRQDRLVWLWPLQAIVLAFVCSAWMRLGTTLGRVARLTVPLVIVGATLINPMSIARATGWVRDGWAGRDAVEIQIVDYLASEIRAQGRDHAAIGYRRFTDAPLAPPTDDRSWKPGAEFDMALESRHGITNLNQCIEGLSAQDDYRVIEAIPPTGDLYYFDVAARGPLHMLRRIGQFELYSIGPLQ